MNLLILYFVGAFILVSLSTMTKCQINRSQWGRDTSMENRAEVFLNWLILGCDRQSSCVNDLPPYRHVEYPGYDGFYNNLAKPTQGAIDTPLLRVLPPVYADGVYQPVERKANPINVSRAVMQGSNGETSKTGLTAFLLFFGQQVVEEVLDAQGAACPPEYFNIEIPDDHEYMTQDPKVPVLPFLRTRYDMSTGFSPNNPRQQLNEITPYIDGGLVYGSGKGWADVLRLRKDGTLEPDGKLASHSELGSGFPAENAQRMPLANPPPPTNHSFFVERESTANVDRFFKLGNPRGNENPFLLTFGIFWFRWHNTIAGFLKKKYPDWEGERIFNEARKWVIATQQSVTMYDWLQKYLKIKLEKYTQTDTDGREKGGYDPSVDPQISHVFQSAAMRFGHTLVPSGVYLRKRASENCATDSFSLDPHSTASSIEGVRTCNSFWRSPELFTSNKDNFERFILGMSSQSTEREDNIIVDDLRGRVFGPLEFSRRDLMAVNIQRGRDHGLPDYNTARKHFGLESIANLSPEEYKSKTSSTVPDEVVRKLAEQYENDPSKVDIWPGGLLETNNGPGQLFSAIIREQFERIRHGDRFWFENKRNGLFREEEIERISSVKIIDILLSVTDITLDDIQEDPFLAPRHGNDVSRCSDVLSNEVSCLVYTPENRSWTSNTCKYLPPLSDTNLELCTAPKTYDYFTGSVLSYILTFLFVGIAILGIFLTVNIWILVKQKRKSNVLLSSLSPKEGQFICKERVSFLEKRIVIVSFDTTKMQIVIQSNIGKVLRMIELANLEKVVFYHSENYHQIIVRVENHYDLFLIFSQTSDGKKLFDSFSEFCKSIGKQCLEAQKASYQLIQEVITFKDREEELKEVLSFVLGEQAKSDASKEQQLQKIKLTKTELANALGMTVDNTFFKQFFYLMDSNRDGFISFQEFITIMMMFKNGTEEEKARLFFHIYDLDHSGTLSANDFKLFIKSTCGSEVKDQTTDQIVESLLEAVGLHSPTTMTFEQFYEIFKRNKIFKEFVPKFNAKESKRLTQRRKGQFSIYGQISNPNDTTEEESLAKYSEKEDKDIKQNYISELIRKCIKGNDKLLFWGFIYTAVMILVFAERAYYYSVEREHAGLRRIAGYGVTVTRGAASAIMFTYSSLLVTMCRNALSSLRSSFIHKYFPFDEMIELHKYISWWALFWTLVHVIGHAINFYHISTQTPSDLICLFRNFFRGTHVLPKFHYWCWETVTGLTGVFLVIQIAIIYIFAVQARRHLYKAFWLTHNTYPLLYFLTILHGSGQLVQPPFFHFFFLGPCILFALDKIVSLFRRTVKIRVIGAKHLPSDVTLLRIERPLDFSYQSGQWIRIACIGINEQEFHPFTISSAPHEKDITIHIRAVGPWTKAIRKVNPDYETVKLIPSFKYPEIYIDGPFGEGHQMWWSYEVVVFVGGGIGVTPFASILKDIAFKSTQPITTFRCKKVFFLWVTRSQKQFEWMTDILRQVEEADVKGIIRNHIFITQFKEKYDFRTTLLYHAERHFHKISGRSIITGLKAVTHFSRPNFTEVFKAIRKHNQNVPLIGVFTCSGLSVSSAVDSGVRAVNRETSSSTIFTHYYENF